MGQFSNQARRKFRRADQHIDALHKSTERWVTKNANSGVIEDDPKSGERVLRIKLKSRPPVLDWGVLIGDAIHNLRSGLDQLVWLIGGNPPRNPKTSEFPIYIDGKKFRQKGMPAISSLPSGAKEIIEGVQPCVRFKTAKVRERSGLWVLQQSSNADKHHTLHLGVITAANRPGGVTLPKTFLTPLEHDDVLRRWSASDPNKPQRAKNCRLSLFIALDPEGPGRGRAAVDLLRAISSEIDESIFRPLQGFL